MSTHFDDDCSEASSSVSRTSSSSSLSALPHEPFRPTIVSPSSSSRSQRLAVLLPNNLWKSDADASECDTLKCPVKFSIFERRHHCRKCGGVFCSLCSSKTTDLLDTTSMPFVIPPSSMPMYLLAASAGPGALVNARVCNDCYSSLNGRQSSFTEKKISPASSSSRPRTASSVVGKSSAAAFQPSSLSSASSSSLQSPVDGTPLPTSTRSASSRPRSRRPALSRTNSSATVPQTPLVRRSSVHSTSSSVRGASKDLGVLDSYPLKISSQGCKLSGAAVWSPRHIPRKYDAPHVFVAASLPDEEDDDEGRDINILRVHGEFQVRAPAKDRVLSSRPEWSTF